MTPTGNLAASQAAIGPHHNLGNTQHFQRHFRRRPGTSLIRNLFQQALRFPSDLHTPLS